jgi:hypothetical protein
VFADAEAERGEESQPPRDRDRRVEALSSADYQEAEMSGATQPVAGLAPLAVSAKDAHQKLRKALLGAGFLSSLLYVVATDVVAASLWDNYSRTGEMVSKLFAVGSPARPVLLVLVGGVYTVLTIAFGMGIWLSAGRNRALRVTGAILIGYGVSNILALLYPLDLNNDAAVPMHIAATISQMVLMLAAMGFGAAAFHGWLRVYSIASLVASVVAGIASFIAAPYAPTPVLGIGERISIGAFLLWVAVLAVALWRAPVDAADQR